MESTANEKKQDVSLVRSSKLIVFLGDLHPAVQLFAWMALVISVQILSPLLVFLFCALLTLSAFKLSGERFAQLLRKTRWIAVSLLLIYAYTSPGELLWAQLGILSPVYEGVIQGLLQLARLIIVLAGLAILLTQLTQSQLISGLYTWLKPLDFLGGARKRAAIRLALTLSYADHALNDMANWKDNLEHMIAPQRSSAGSVELTVKNWTKSDYLAIVLITLVLLGSGI